MRDNRRPLDAFNPAELDALSVGMRFWSYSRGQSLTRVADGWLLNATVWTSAQVIQLWSSPVFDFRLGAPHDV